jgi:hypothetical protein
MPKVSINNFRAGIQGSPGFTPDLRNVAASDMRNLTVDENGKLVRRAGRARKWATAETTNRYLRVIPTVYNAAGASAVHNLFVQTKAGLKYWTGSALAAVTINPSGASAAEFNTRFDWVVASNRLFLANGQITLWVEILNVPTGTVPVAYWWGITPNANSGYSRSTLPTITAADQSGGSLGATQFYGYAFTYYSDPDTGLDIGAGARAQKGTGAESLPSAVVTEATTSSNKTIRVANMLASDDPQITHKRIYRTENGTSASSGFATAAEAAAAPLKYFHTIPDATITYDDDGSVFAGLDTITSSGYDNPPTTLSHLAHYAGRIWGASDNSSTVHFTPIDGTGSPVYDAFPDASAAVPQKFFANKWDGDVITALAPASSGQEMHIFKQHSTIMLRGTGLITGVQAIPTTGTQTAVNLDVSFTNRSAGCASPLSVATVQDMTFFLAQDKQVWVSQGGQLTPISLPIQPVLDTIPSEVFDVTTIGDTANTDRNGPVIGWIYKNKYFMAFPTEEMTSGQTRCNKIAVYDLLRQYWTIFDTTGADGTDYGIQDAIWVPIGSPTGAHGLSNDQLYAITRDDGTNWYLETYLTGTQDQGSDFTASYTTNELPMPTDSVVNGVYVIPTLTPTATQAVTTTLTVDGTDQAAVTFSTAKSRRYRQGVFGRGKTFKLKVAGTTLDNLERLELEYQTMER